MNEPLIKAKDIIGKRKTLPVLPKIAQKIIALTADEFVELSALADCIEEDPIISARIVGIANSAFYGQKNEITSVEEAIIRVLGLDLARGIAIGMACTSVLDATLVAGFDRERFWRSSLTHSSLSFSISKNSTVLAGREPLCSLAGLLTNIGLLAAVALAPSETQDALDANSESLHSQMTLTLGCDHRHMTAALAELWTLPKDLQEVYSIRCTDNWVPDESPPLLACLHLASMFKQHDLDVLEDFPQTSQLSKVLGLSKDLEPIMVGQTKSEPGIAEIARVLGAN